MSVTALCGGIYYTYPISFPLSTFVGLVGLKVLHSMFQSHKSEIYHELSLVGFKLLKIYNPNNFEWWHPITDDFTDYSIILGALPLTSDHCNQIADQAQAILSVVKKNELKGISFFDDPVTEENWQEKGIEQKILPVVDLSAPTQEQIKDGVEFIYRNIQEKKKVYVHCKSGKGRSTVLVICYLMHHYNLSYDKAFNLVKKCRPWIQLTWCQIKAVKDYESNCCIVK